MTVETPGPGRDGATKTGDEAGRLASASRVVISACERDRRSAAVATVLRLLMACAERKTGASVSPVADLSYEGTVVVHIVVSSAAICRLCRLCAGDARALARAAGGPQPDEAVLGPLPEPVRLLGTGHLDRTPEPALGLSP